jgi:hypothetical protein
MVQGRADLLNIIIPFFMENPLVTDKWADFQMWATAINKLSKSRPPQDEFNDVLTYYAAINRGMSKKNVERYPGVQRVERPTREALPEIKPEWLSRFVAGDGHFSVSYRADVSSYVYTVDITQHTRDADVLAAILDYLGCGHFYARTSTPRADIKVQNLDQIYTYILPHFSKYPLYNIKQIDFDLFKEAIEILYIQSKRVLSEVEKNRLGFILDNWDQLFEEQLSKISD